MSIFIWRILCIAAALLFVITVIVLFATRLLKNKYYHNFTADELFRKTKTTNSVNSIYFTSGETKKFIKKYVLCESPFDRYLVCNYAKSFKQIKFFIVQYSALKHVVAVTEVIEGDTGNASKVIALNRRCAHVNIIISQADGYTVNSEVIRPIAMYKLRLYAFLKSAAIFLGLFIIRHAILELFGGIYLTQYLNHFLNYAAIGGSFFLSLLIYLITVLCFRRKNCKNANGGVLEYEFV